jgi:hypothetical protein
MADQLPQDYVDECSECRSARYTADAEDFHGANNRKARIEQNFQGEPSRTYVTPDGRITREESTRGGSFSGDLEEVTLKNDRHCA